MGEKEHKNFLDLSPLKKKKKEKSLINNFMKIILKLKNNWLRGLGSSGRMRIIEEKSQKVIKNLLKNILI